MKLLLILLFLSITIISYSQFPISKNIKTAKSELIELLKKRGYHLLKSEEVDKDFDYIKYSEEFTVYLGKSNYENVDYITFSTFKKSVYEKLKKTFNYNAWNYAGEYPNVANEIESVYSYKNYRIRMPHPDGAFQFIVRLNDEE